MDVIIVVFPDDENEEPETDSLDALNVVFTDEQ